MNNQDIQPDATAQYCTELHTPADALSDKQLAGIDLMLSGKSMVCIAQSLGVCRRTIYNWRDDDLFKEVLDQRRREMWSCAAARLQAMVHPSLDIVERELKNPYDRARWRAATAVLRLVDLRKTATMDER